MNNAQAETMTSKELVSYFADKYDVSQETMIRIINCENAEWNPALQSRIIKKGKREESWGLVQIHLLSHPEITKEQATDASFSIEFLAKYLSLEKGKMWSCF